MKLKEAFTEEIKNIKFKKCGLDSLVNSQEYLNSENTFRQYLNQDYEEYFSRPKHKNWPAEIEPKISQLKQYLKGDILELGAGSCRTSAAFSTLPEVNSLTCVEFSESILLEIGPRTILHYGGKLDKFRFIVGDMNRVENFNDKKYDAIVLFEALHHVFLPFFQIERWHDLLKPNGVIICINEPAIADICLPTRKNKEWIDHQINHQRQGNNENYYTASYFKKLFTKFNKFDFIFLNNHKTPLKNRLDSIKRLIWYKKINLFFVAIKK